MPKRTSTQSRRFDCSKCGSVIFRVEETELTDDNGDHVSTTVDRVKGFGTCAVFKASGGKATESDLSTCPVYAENYAPPKPEAASATPTS